MIPLRATCIACPKCRSRFPRLKTCRQCDGRGVFTFTYADRAAVQMLQAEPEQPRRERKHRKYWSEEGRCIECGGFDLATRTRCASCAETHNERYRKDL